MKKTMKKCDHCKEYKEDEEFNWRYKALGIRHNTCRECAHIFNKKYFEGPAKERHLQQVRERKEPARQVARNFIYQYRSNHPCESCGESDVRVLEFHHVGDKDMAVGAMVSGGFSIERIVAEISKCTVLCANCHRKITVDERGWFRGRSRLSWSAYRDPNFNYSTFQRMSNRVLTFETFEQKVP